MAAPVTSSTPADEAEAVSSGDAEQVFSTSIVISAVRCLLTYVVFPFAAPLVGLTDVGPVIGVALSLVAIYFNIYSIRRFWAADHRWKVPMSTLNVGVIILVSVLLVLDLQTLFG